MKMCLLVSKHLLSDTDIANTAGWHVDYMFFPWYSLELLSSRPYRRHGYSFPAPSVPFSQFRALLSQSWS